jgi:DNA polymerase-3 subunit delta
MAGTFTLVCGGDDYLVAREGGKVWETLCREVEDPYSREVVDGAAGTVAEADAAAAGFAAAVMTMPMFGGKKCVWLRGVSFFSDTVLGRTEGAKTALEKIVKVLEKVNPAEVGVLVTASPVDRRRKEFKRLSEIGTVQVLGDEKGESPALRILDEELSKCGGKMNPDAAYALVEKIHASSRLAMEEARKLSLYADGEPITMEMVGALVPPFGEGDFFEAVDAFYSLDLSQALAAIRRHFFAGNDIRPLISSLQNRARLLLQLRVLFDAGLLRGGVNKTSLAAAEAKYGGNFPEGVKSAANVFSQNPYYLSRLMETARQVKVKKLIDIQMEMVRAFSEAIERPGEQEAVMIAATVRCLAE